MTPAIRLMSFNIRCHTAADGPHAWPHRRDLAADAVRRNAPDVLGLQEAQPGQLQDLRLRLPEYASFGVGRDDGGTRGEHVPILYRHDRFTLADAGTWWLSPTPDAPGSVGWDAALPRIATWAILHDHRDAGRPHFVVNTHLDHRGPRARLASARLLVDRLAPLDHPRIVMGDFNCTDADPPILLLAAAFTDTYRHNHPPHPDEATYHRFAGGARGHRIDFIFTRGYDAPGADIDRTTHAGRYPSDHFPVTATVHPC